MSERPPLEPNTLGKTSLFLGTMSLFFVFSIGLCAGIGVNQGWIRLVGTLLFFLGAIFAFLGLLAAILGFFGLFGRNKPRGAAFVGLLFGTAAVFLFLAALKAAQQAP